MHNLLLFEENISAMLKSLVIYLSQKFVLLYCDIIKDMVIL